MYSSNNPGTNPEIPGSILLRKVWNPKPIGIKSVWLGAHNRCPAAPGDVSSHPRSRGPSVNVQLQRSVGKNGHPPGRYRPARWPLLLATYKLFMGNAGLASRTARSNNYEECVYPGSGNYLKLLGLEVIFFSEEILHIPCPRGPITPP